MTFYLKYRPQKIAELDLTQVKRALSQIIASGKIPHALLFAGPKGSGKTSAARILAKALNCQTNKKFSEPCNKCSNCLEITTGSSMDVVEIDAASYRGIDDVRAIREAVRLSPAKSHFRIYIIDEAHMLTTEAFNALLKTLEEPPAHVVFILATTALAKIPQTIQSRCLLVRFNKAKQDEIISSLSRVAAGEKLVAGKEVLVEIAKISDGSFRDAAKILEQVVLGGKITAEAVREVAGTSSEPEIREFLSYLSNRDTKKALPWIERLAEGGADFRTVNQSILAILHSLLLKHFGVEEEGMDIEDFAKFGVGDLKALITLFSQAVEEAKITPIPQLPLELAVITWCEGGMEVSQPIHLSRNSAPRDAGTGSRGSRAVSRGDVHPLKPASDTRDWRSSAASTSLKEKSKKGEEAIITEEIWAKILREVKPRNHSVEALLRSTRPVNFDGRTLTLEVFYKFHKERLEQETYRKIVEEVGSGVLGKSIRIVCLLSERSASPQESQRVQKETANLEPVVDEDIVKAAQEIFGGKLVD